jgi:hypothetical protein
MALTITEKMRASIGGKLIVNYQITHDGSDVDITAASLGMHCIEGILGYSCKVSMQANTSIPMNIMMLSIQTGGSAIAWGESDANAVSRVTLFGW